MNDLLEYGALLRIARAAQVDIGRVRRVLEGEAGVLPDERARRVLALAREALSRLHPCRRVRVLAQEART